MGGRFSEPESTAEVQPNEVQSAGAPHTPPPPPPPTPSVGGKSKKRKANKRKKTNRIR
jgi:hypothetical protein